MPSEQPTILIVDDEAYICMLIEQTLEELEDDGVTILTASNGEEALAMILEYHPSLIFLDVMMPKMNGFEVCKQVKNELNLADIYIVILTARGQEPERENSTEVGADLYITKPFDPDILLEIAQRVLG